MLRPATPLSLLLGVAFVLLLLATISTPIIQAIPLGSFRDAKFGVFGFCNSQGCSSVGIGYDVSSVFPKNLQQFDLPLGVRHTLSSILILHPVAAFLTLVMFALAVAAHLHKTSHSARYLLLFTLLDLVTLLVCIAAFVIDVLLFIPHMAWGTYIVLAATILVFLSGLVSCAMRRTLVSRKSRKKRIDENAEMSGENYYNREAQMPKKDFSVPTTQPTVPIVSGGNGDNLPAFATFERKDDQVSDERIPLTQRTTSERSPNTAHAMTTGVAVASDAGSYNAPSRTPSQDRYGNYNNNNNNGPPDAYGASRGGPYDRMNRMPVRRDTDPAGGYRGGRGGYTNPMRGRGGYGPPPRGGYGPRGRGGYGPPPRHGYGTGNMAGGAGRTPPPGYNNYNNTGGQYDRPYPSSQATQSNPSVNQSVVSGNGGYAAYTPSLDLPRAESPPPLPGTEPIASAPAAHAVEMDATSPAANNFREYSHIRDGDTDVAGMVGLQQGKAGRPDTLTSDGSKYEDESYVPPRAMWSQSPGRGSPRTGSPADGPRGPATNLSGTTAPVGGRRNNGNYYEDVDPQFDVQGNQLRQHVSPQRSPPPVDMEYEEVRGAARSPAESERSNFTSISQRGVNPNYREQPPMPQQGGHYNPTSRRPVQQRQDMILDNPDFKVPGGRSAARTGGGGMIPGSAYPTGGM